MSGCPDRSPGGADRLVLVVFGVPGPQGSKRYVGNGRMIESSAKVRPWREAVALAARRLIAPYGPEWVPLDGPLRVRMVFSLRRPQRPRWPWPAVPPDVSKLARSTEDALTGLLWRDDARVVDYERLSKVYAGANDPEALAESGAVVKIWRISENTRK